MTIDRWQSRYKKRRIKMVFHRIGAHLARQVMVGRMRIDQAFELVGVKKKAIENLEGELSSMIEEGLAPSIARRERDALSTISNRDLVRILGPNSIFTRSTDNLKKPTERDIERILKQRKLKFRPYGAMIPLRKTDFIAGDQGLENLGKRFNRADIPWIIGAINYYIQEIKKWGPEPFESNTIRLSKNFSLLSGANLEVYIYNLNVKGRIGVTFYYNGHIRENKITTWETTLSP